MRSDLSIAPTRLLANDLFRAAIHITEARRLMVRSRHPLLKKVVRASQALIVALEWLDRRG